MSNLWGVKHQKHELPSLIQCFNSWISDECSKPLILGLFSFITLSIAIFQCWRTVSAKFSPQLATMFLVVIQSLTLCIHYVFLRNILVMRFVQRYLHVVTLCLIFFFFTALACRVLGKQKFVSRLVIPSLLSFLLGISFIFGYSLGSSPDNRDIWFLVLSSVSLCLSVMFIFVGRVVTRKPKIKKTIAFTMLKRKRLWFLIVVNLIVSGLMFSADVFSFRPVSNQQVKKTGEDLFLWIFHRVFTTLFPIWAIMLVIFSLSASSHPQQEKKRLEESLLQEPGRTSSEQQIRQSSQFQNISGEDFEPLTFSSQNFEWGSLNLSQPPTLSITDAQEFGQSTS